MHGTGWVLPVLLALFAISQVLSAARKAKDRSAVAGEPDAAAAATLPAAVLSALYRPGPQPAADIASAPPPPRPQVRVEPRRAPTPARSPRPGPPPARAAVPPLLAAFADPAHARNAVIVAEVLGPPVALR